MAPRFHHPGRDASEGCRGAKAIARQPSDRRDGCGAQRPDHNARQPLPSLRVAPRRAGGHRTCRRPLPKSRRCDEMKTRRGDKSELTGAVNERRSRRVALFFVITLILLAVFALLGVSVGSVHIPASQVARLLFARVTPFGWPDLSDIT